MAARQVRDTRLRLLGATGTTDNSDYQRTGIAYNGAVSVVDGVFDFPGTTADYISCGTSDDFDIRDVSEKPFTWTAWAKLDTSPINSRILFAVGTSNYNAFSLAVKNNLKLYIIGDTTGTSSWDILQSAGSSITLGEWYMLSLTRDTSGVYRLYINGELSFSHTNTSDLFIDANTLTIGSHYSQTADQYMWDGQIEGPTVIARALSAGELETLYNFRVVSFEPVGLLDEFQARLVLHFTRSDLRGRVQIDERAHWAGVTGVTDQTRFDNDATAQGTVVIGGSGFTCAGPGSGDYLDCGNDASLNPTNTISVSCEVTIDTQVNFAGLVMRGTGGAGTYGMRLWSDGKIAFFVRNSANLQTAQAFSASAITLGQTHRVTAVYDGTTVTVYLDGVAGTPVSQPSGSGIYSSTHVNTVGVDLFDAANRVLDGTINHIRISERYLSAAWVAILHGKGDILDSGVYNGYATRIGGATTDGSVLTLDGTTGYLIVPDHYSLDLTSALTLSCYYTPVDINDAGQLIQKADTNLDDDNYLLRADPGGIIGYDWTSGAGGSGNRSRLATVSGHLTNGVKTHIAVTHVSGTDPIIYIDGVAVATTYLQGGGTRALTSYPVDVCIGADGNRSPAAGFIQGDLEDVRIIGTDLTPAEIKFLASESEVETPNTLGADAAWLPSYQAGHASGLVNLIDYSGRGNVCTLTNMDPATDWAVDTTRNGVEAIDYDGSDDYAPSGFISNPATWTVACWAKKDVHSTWHGLITNKSAFSDGVNLTFYGIGGNKVSCAAFNAYVTSVTNVNTDQWYFILATYDGTSVRLYLDGSLERTTARAAAWTSTPWTIGAFYGSGGLPLDGRIDGVYIWPRVLTASQQAAIYADERAWPDEVVAAGGVIPYRLHQKQKLILGIL